MPSRQRNAALQPGQWVEDDWEPSDPVEPGAAPPPQGATDPSPTTRHLSVCSPRPSVPIAPLTRYFRVGVPATSQGFAFQRPNILPSDCRPRGQRPPVPQNAGTVGHFGTRGCAVQPLSPVSLGRPPVIRGL